jgi:non-specific serine/threonine protein kinase/serine/threonine-protein kinase
VSDDPDEGNSSLLPSTETTPSHSDEGQQIGPYHLLQKIGEGGMGEVWLAEQLEPVRRKVALKVVKQGMDTKWVVARFEAERQALAVMDHPSVAKVFEAGATRRGRPYFVMEYVRGVPITEYCDQHRLTTKERLELFLAVCEGVQHAHQKAIIHRDLKPSNVLVTDRDGRPVPKIIDFGVAKATAQRLTEKTLFTGLGMLIGTPEYMSPEQAGLTGEDVDTRTDVYSLGVILYELLVGALPFESKELRAHGFEGVVRMIREQDPKRPSLRLATLGEPAVEAARKRRIDSSTMLRQLRGDLDSITMKAMEKDRSRRYGSPMDLAADLGRYLSDEPVQARAPSAAYRARKFVRRHRLGVTAAAVVGAALLAGIVGTTTGLVRAQRAEMVARTEQERATGVATFLSDMLKEFDPIGMGKTLRADLVKEIEGQGAPPVGQPHPAGFWLDAVNTVDVARRLLDQEVLHKAVRKIEDELKDEPALAAELYHAVGSSYFSLQLYDRAGDSFARAATASERAHGAGAEMTLHLKGDIGDSYRRAGRYREAEAIYREALEPSRRMLGEEAKQTLLIMNALGAAIVNLGRLDEAESLHREALEKLTRTAGPEDEETLKAVNNLALVRRDQGRLEEAEKLLSETIEKMKRALGSEHQQTLNSQNNLASVLLLSGRAAEAERLLGESLEKSRRVLGEEAYLTLYMRRHLADAYLTLGRVEESEALMRDNLRQLQRILGERHPVTLGQLQALAMLLIARGRAGESVPISLEALAGYKAVLGEAHARTLATANVLGEAYARLGRGAEAEEVFRATARTLSESRPKHLDPVYAEAAYRLACLNAARGDRENALEWLKASLDAGFSPSDPLSQQSELASLHGPEFDALLKNGDK